MILGMVPGFGGAVGQNLFEAYQGGWDHPSVVHLFIRGHLGCQMGEMAQTGCFWAKSVCYSPRFWRWTRGSEVSWAKN